MLNVCFLVDVRTAQQHTFSPVNTPHQFLGITGKVRDVLCLGNVILPAAVVVFVGPVAVLVGPKVEI